MIFDWHRNGFTSHLFATRGFPPARDTNRKAGAFLGLYPSLQSIRAAHNGSNAIIKNALSHWLRANKMSVVPPEFGQCPHSAARNGGVRRAISGAQLGGAFTLRQFGACTDRSVSENRLTGLLILVNAFVLRYFIIFLLACQGKTREKYRFTYVSGKRSKDRRLSIAVKCGKIRQTMILKEF